MEKPPPPLPNSRFDQLEKSLQGTPDEMVVAAYYVPKDSLWISAADIRSMIAELRRRRRKMGYQGD